MCVALCLLLLFAPAGRTGQSRAAEGEPPSLEAPQAPSTSPADELPEGLTGAISVEPADAPADVVLRNRHIVTLRARYEGISPEERARGVIKRFEKAVSRREFPDATMRRFKPAALFWVGETPILGITASDLDPLGGESLDQVGAETLVKINLVLAGIREQRDLRAFLRSLAMASLATLLYGAVVFTIGHLESFLDRRITGGRISLAELRPLASIAHRAIIIVAWLTRLFLGYLWVAFTLKLFPYTRPWGERLGAYLVSTFEGIALGILRALPDLFTVVVVFVIARFLIRVARAFFTSVEAGKVKLRWMYPEMVPPTRRILVAVIWIFAIVAVYPYLPGSGSEAFKGLSVLLGLMISLGGTGVVSQAMSGLVLMYSRALRADDYVRIGETEGVVISLGMLATKIRTPMHEEITIPNSVILGTSTKNYSRLAPAEGVILHTTVSIGYAEPWRKVHERLMLAAARTKGLKKEPKPFVTQMAFSDFNVEYRLNAYLERPEERFLTLAALHENIQDSLNEVGIVIVSPHYVADPPQPSPPQGEGLREG